MQADEGTTIKSDDLFVRFKAFLKAENMTYRDQRKEMKSHGEVGDLQTAP